MKIRRIRLQNIKSYTDQEIFFQAGVNFISGINGAGKSTIIEAIGYALFDYNPYPNAREFIRYGAKSGLITVDFTANDERDYRVARKVVTSWAVFDLETEGELDLHGAIDIKYWLKEAMGVDRDIELDQLFRDIIGVPQGTFVAPFLETPSLRKKKFDGILKVEQYRDAYNNSAKAAATLKNNIDSKNTKLLLMQKDIQDYDQIKNNINELYKQISDLKAKLDQTKEMAALKQKEINSLEEIKATLEKNQNELKTLEKTRELLLERQQELNVNLEKAGKAREITLLSEKGYQAYFQAAEKLNQLENQRTAKEKLEREYNQLQQKITEVQTTISQKENANAKNQKEIAEGKNLLAAQIKELDAAIDSSRTQLADIQKKFSRITNWSEAEEKLNKLISSADKARIDMQNKLEQLAVISEEEKQLNQSLLEYQQTEKIAATYEDKFNAYQKARDDYSALDSRLKILRSNLEQSKGGMCPFLESPCQNVGGNLEQFFTGQINETSEQMKELSSIGKNLKKLVEEADKARNNLTKMQSQRDRLTQLLNQRNKLQDELSSLINEIKILPLDKAIADLEASANIDCSGKESALQEIRQLSTAEDCRRNLDNILSRLESIARQSAESRDTVGTALNEEHTKGSARHAGLEKDLENAGENLKQLEAKEKELIADSKFIAEKKSEETELLGKATALKNQLVSYENLAGEMAEAKSDQEKYRVDYDNFMQHRLEAEKVEALESNSQDCANQLITNQKRNLELSELITQLRVAFDPTLYQQKQNELISLKELESKDKQILIERQSDLTEAETKIKTMDKIKKEMDNQREEMASAENCLSLLNLIRNTLNKAGPPIAKVYLENLSREANEIYRQVSRENVALEWREGYDIVLVDNFGGRKRERSFKQFSGGEQMTAALAVRLALLKQQSRVKLGFFDEPTQNLDSDRRTNLAETIPHVTGGFDQIYIISHDDTFDEITENIIQLKKDIGDGTGLIS